MFGLQGFAGRLASAAFYGVLVFIGVFIIGIILVQFSQTVEIGDLLKKWSPILGLLAGAVVFFNGSRPV
jgi:hypothetical protein